MSIITLAEAKRQLRIPASDTSQDVELQEYVDGVTGAVEDYKGEIIDPRSVVEKVSLTRAVRTLVLRHTPVISIDDVQSVDGDITWDTSDMDIDDVTGTLRVLTGPPLVGVLNLTYTAGYVDIPGRYKRGGLVILQHAWETQRGGTAGPIGGGVIGSEEVYDPRYSYSIPRKALEWLGSPLGGCA